MFPLKSMSLCIILTCWSGLSSANYHTVSQQEWLDYMREFGKDYTNTAVTESYARYYFNYNMGIIRKHNLYYDRGQRTYKLKENQFTDMRLASFNELFPTVRQPAVSNDSPLLPLQDAPPRFDPNSVFGINIHVENQGIECNSGWAYAAAKAIELMQAIQSNNLSPAILSAQNLIDCAGRGAGCKNQVPQTAFDYLTVFGQDLHLESDYKNALNQSEPGMCLPNGMIVTNLGKYARIANGDDAKLMQIVAAGYPVVIEFNPTSFDFMHYAEGVFQPGLAATKTGAHHLVVLGYDRDTKTGLDYWLCLNSFDTTWGDAGFIKIHRDPKKPITKSAIFPMELA